MTTYGNRVLLDRQLYSTSICCRHRLRVELLANVFSHIFQLPGLFLPVDDEHPIFVILDITIHLGPEGDTEIIRSLLHVGPGKAKHGHTGWDAFHDRFRRVVVATHHTIQDAMWLDVMKGDAFSLKKPLQRPDLINGYRSQFLGRHLDLTPTKASASLAQVSVKGFCSKSPIRTLDIWQTRMRSNLDTMLLAISNRFLHDQWVARMEAAGDVGMINERQKLQIWTADIVAVLACDQTESHSRPQRQGRGQHSRPLLNPH